MPAGPTGNEWRITPRDNGTYAMYPPGAIDRPANPPMAVCYPAQNYAIELNISGLMSLEDFHLSLIRRVTTLVEAARINEQVKVRKLVDDGDHSDSACSACGRNPEKYVAWGFTCERKGCDGKYFPALKNPAR